MSSFEVPEPILNSPFERPQEHWWIMEGQMPERRPGRRPAMYYYREPGRDSAGKGGYHIELKRVNLIRERLDAWRAQGWPGATRTTRDLLEHWRHPERDRRLFFAQIEAAETVIFLTEARADFLQGIEIPRDEPSDVEKAQGYTGFLRYACKMATGSGKTTVMGMLAAWSILNKVQDRGDARFSDVVLIVCPNVTIRDRLRELDPAGGEMSLYHTRYLVPGRLRELLSQGRVLVMNWHNFQPQTPQSAGDGGRVVKAGVEVQTSETVKIGEKNDTKRGTRWLTRETLFQQIAHGLIVVKEGDPEIDMALKIESTRYQESDTALVNRVLRDARGKQNILVFNDEAHHAYRVKVERPEDWDEMDAEEKEAWVSDKTEATVWVDGLDRIHKLRGINTCIDLSATPYFLNRVGQEANRPFPWVVSDFGLIDAIESGLVKIPQLAIRDNTGSEIPGYFNIWEWIMQPGRLTARERGGSRANPKPEAILKWAQTPIAMLGGMWEGMLEQWRESTDEKRPPVFILVCKNTKLANVIHDWLANGKSPAGISPSKLEGFRNTPETIRTILVHSKIMEDADEGSSKGDEVRWMRFTLDTVGKLDWPRDSMGRELFPDGFLELAEKLERPLTPPGREVRCIVSVAMLTEGWDCNTVTHVVGLRPFQSQLLCEQVVGRALRRASYETNENGLMREEVAKIFGVPFQLVPFKANPSGPPPPAPKRHHVRSMPEKASFEIRFPRVEGYVQEVRRKITLDWDNVPSLRIDPLQIPPEVEMKGLNYSEEGKPSLMGPGAISEVSLQEFRDKRRVQELVFDAAATLTREFRSQNHCEIPATALFPQVARLVNEYARTKVTVEEPADLKDLFLSPYFGWLVEVLRENLKGDIEAGEALELPLLEQSRGDGSTADVDFWTGKDVREVVKSHLNYVVADTKQWEQSAAYLIDSHSKVESFVKNAGLGLGIPYFHNGEMHDYVPDFIIRFKERRDFHLILETKGFDRLKDIKNVAAVRWCSAVNAHGGYGRWEFQMVDGPGKVNPVLDEVAGRSGGRG